MLTILLCLFKNLKNEVNAIMEAEKKADAKFAQQKNPVYFMDSGRVE